MNFTSDPSILWAYLDAPMSSWSPVANPFAITDRYALCAAAGASWRGYFAYHAQNSSSFFQAFGTGFALARPDPRDSFFLSSLRGSTEREESKGGVGDGVTFCDAHGDASVTFCDVS